MFRVFFEICRCCTYLECLELICTVAKHYQNHQLFNIHMLEIQINEICSFESSIYTSKIQSPNHRFKTWLKHTLHPLYSFISSSHRNQFPAFDDGPNWVEGNQSRIQIAKSELWNAGEKNKPLKPDFHHFEEQTAKPTARRGVDPADFHVFPKSRKLESASRSHCIVYAE